MLEFLPDRYKLRDMSVVGHPGHWKCWPWDSVWIRAAVSRMIFYVFNRASAAGDFLLYKIPLQSWHRRCEIKPYGDNDRICAVLLFLGVFVDQVICDAREGSFPEQGRENTGWIKKKPRPAFPLRKGCVTIVGWEYLFVGQSVCGSIRSDIHGEGLITIATAFAVFMIIWLIFLIFLFRTLLRKYGNSCLGAILFLFLFMLPIGIVLFMMASGWMLDPETDRMVNVYINLFLIAVGAIVLLPGLVLYFIAWKSQDQTRKSRSENILLFGGTAITLGFILLMKTLSE